MKKIVSTIIVLLLAIGLTFFNIGQYNSKAQAGTTTQVPTYTGKITVDNALQIFNSDMIRYYNMCNIDINDESTWFYTKKIKRNKNEYFLNKNILEESLSYDNYRNLFVVYGNQNSISSNKHVFFKGKDQYRYLGFNNLGDYFENPDYPFDGWSGKKMHEWTYFYQPWRNTKLLKKIGNDINRKISFNDFCGDSRLEENIQKGLDEIRANQTGEDLLPDPGGLRGNRLYIKGEKPTNPETGQKDFWYNYVQIIQPPTYYSWGHGWMFKTNDANYISVPIAPFCLLEDNLTANLLELPPSSAYTGDTVDIKAVVTSEKNQPITTSAKWEVLDEDNNIVDSKPISNFEIVNGVMNNTFNYKVREGVNTIRFTVNDANNPNPKEKDDPGYADNVVEVTVIGSSSVIIPGSVTLEYDVLSVDYSRELNRGNGIFTSLSLPESSSTTKYSWTSNTTTGALTVGREDDRGIFSSWKVERNEDVSNDALEIWRWPVVSAEIHRRSLGDNPGVIWLNNFTNPVYIPEIYYRGKVERDYIREKYQSTGIVKDGKEIFDWQNDGGGQTSAVFSPEGREPITVKALVYNGMRNIPRVPSRKFKNGPEETGDPLKKKIFWESEEYNIPVQRWMRHLDVNGNTKSKEVRAGRDINIRKFTQQNSAEISFKVDRSMEDWFSFDRENALNYKKGTDYYPRAPFATDFDFRNFDFPLKSGYWLNSCGTYGVTIKTLTYKDKMGPTEDHQQLIEKVKDAFKYYSNIVYTHDGKDKYNIHFDRNNKEFVDIRVKTKVGPLYEELPHSPNDNKETHRYFKEILEGWSESGTEESYNNYKYREYVSDDELHIYKVTESTTLTFNINKDNIRQFTHLELPNSQGLNDYWMCARFEDFDYHGKVTETGILDSIYIYICGSATDDITTN